MLLIHDLGEAYIGDYPPMYIDREKKRKEENSFCEGLFLSGLHRDVADMYDYYLLWKDWYNYPNSNNYNIQIAKEIDKIQMLYKLLVLLSQDPYGFLEHDRIRDFWTAINDISTPEGKKVFNVIIADNEYLRKTAKENDIFISELA